VKHVKSLSTLALLALLAMVPQGCKTKPAGKVFANPEAAAQALLEGLKANDLPQRETIFGAGQAAAFASGDDVSDRHDREVIGLAMQQSWRWAPLGTDRKELIIGDEQWPFPIPLMKAGDGWQFDTEAGKQEVLARRIGRNEIGVVDLCRAYVVMQRQYASEPRDGKVAGMYAERIRSTPGRQDGLYWSAGPSEPPSPMGDLVAEAEAEGYDEAQSTAKPFWGYHFRILHGQGAAASGGAKSYFVNGNLSGGFALVAYPAKYRQSGVMTFIVNHEGVVFEKDLGEQTAKAASSMEEYSPDSSWVQVPAR